MAISDEQLAARLARHDEYFCEVVNLVPPHLYIPQDEPDPNVRYFKNKKLAAPLQQKKEESAKGKKVKFDPVNMKSVTQVQKEKAEKDKQARIEGDKMDVDDEEEAEDEEGGAAEEDSDDDDDGVAMEEDDDDEEPEGEGPTKQEGGGQQAGGAKKAPLGPLSLVGTTPRAKSIEELKERLKLKIQEARSRRGFKAGEQTKRPPRNQKPQANKKRGLAPPPPKGAAPTGKQAAEAQKAPKQPEEPLDLQFGKISVPDDKSKGLKKGGKNLVNLLKKAEEKEKRLNELRQASGDAVVAHDELWKDAIGSARGDKILDNPKLLKKAIKRKQKLKERSQKKWGERLANQEAGKSQKQEKREANIKKRKDGPAAVAAAEEAGAGKKQRRAGFEGKRHEWLNAEGAPGQGGKNHKHQQNHQGRGAQGGGAGGGAGGNKGYKGAK